MKYFSIILLLLAGTLVATPAVQGQKLFKKVKKVTISDPGELHSTYNIGDSEAKTLQENMTKPDKVNEVIEYANESSWPKGLSDFNDRIQESTQELIKKFMAFKVAELGDKYLLWIPAGKNKKSGLPFSHDIYFVIGKSGVK